MLLNTTHASVLSAFTKETKAIELEKLSREAPMNCKVEFNVLQ